MLRPPQYLLSKLPISYTPTLPNSYTPKKNEAPTRGSLRFQSMNLYTV